MTDVIRERGKRAVAQALAIGMFSRVDHPDRLYEDLIEPYQEPVEETRPGVWDRLVGAFKIYNANFEAKADGAT